MRSFFFLQFGFSIQKHFVFIILLFVINHKVNWKSIGRIHQNVRVTASKHGTKTKIANSKKKCFFDRQQANKWLREKITTIIIIKYNKKNHKKNEEMEESKSERVLSL